MLQDMAVWGLVLWASWVVGRGFWAQFAAGGSVCGGCGGGKACGAPAPGGTLVQIESGAPGGSQARLGLTDVPRQKPPAH